MIFFSIIILSLVRHLYIYICVCVCECSRVPPLSLRDVRPARGRPRADPLPFHIYSGPSSRLLSSPLCTRGPFSPTIQFLRFRARLPPLATTGPVAAARRVSTLGLNGPVYTHVRQVQML